MSTFEDTYQTLINLLETYQVKDAPEVMKAILTGALKMDKIKERLYNLVNYNDKHRHMFVNSDRKLFKTEVKTLNVELFPPAKIKKIIQSLNNDKVRENAFWYYLHRMYLQVCIDKRETNEVTTKLYSMIVKNDPSQYEQRLKEEEASRAAEADRIVKQMYEFLKLAGAGNKSGSQIDMRKIMTMMNSLKDQFGSQMNNAKLKISDLVKALLKMAQEEQLQKQEGVTDGETVNNTMDDTGGVYNEANMQKIMKITEICDELQKGTVKDVNQIISILESMKEINVEGEDGGEKIAKLVDKVIASIRNGEKFEIQDIVTSMFTNDQGILDGAKIAKDLMTGGNPLAMLTGSSGKSKDEEELDRLTKSMAEGTGDITAEEMAKFEELAKKYTSK